MQCVIRFNFFLFSLSTIMSTKCLCLKIPKIENLKTLPVRLEETDDVIILKYFKWRNIFWWKSCKYFNISTYHIFFACKVCERNCSYKTVTHTGYSKVRITSFFMTSQTLNAVKTNVISENQKSRLWLLQWLFH